MVKFGLTDLAETMAVGAEAAAYVTTHFISQLDFRKDLLSVLLISKLGTLVYIGQTRI
jgi:hypothetical protein